MAHYKIAGLTVEMTVGGRTAAQGAAYAAPADAAPTDLTVSCDMEKLMARYPEADKGDLEYVGTAASFAKQLIRHQGIVLHSSSVTYGGRAYLFSAYSGTGKSTHTEKWMRLFGAELINDDKPALRREEGQWFAYGTPWSGKGKSRNVKVPVGGIALLERGSSNTIERIAPAQALRKLYPQLPRSSEKEEIEGILALVGQLLEEVPVWLLTCKNEDEAAYVAMREMTGGLDVQDG